MVSRFANGFRGPSPHPHGSFSAVHGLHVASALRDTRPAAGPAPDHPSMLVVPQPCVRRAHPTSPLQINKHMSDDRRRDHYARWDGETTARLVRLILTEETLRTKMLSLIDKFHTKREDHSAKLDYGIMKIYAERIGLGRGDSRATSIKMINIAKSFSRKKDLARLFNQGWRVAREARDILDPDADLNPPNGSAPVTAFEEIVNRITERVVTFTRRPAPARRKHIKKEASGSSPQRTIQSPVATKDRRRSRMSQSPVASQQVLETRSQHLTPLKNPLDAVSDQMSRAGESAHLPNSNPSKSEGSSGLSEDPRRAFENLLRCRKVGLGSPTNGTGQKLQKIVDLHLKLRQDGPQWYDPTKAKTADKLLHSTIRRILAFESDKKSQQKK